MSRVSLLIAALAGLAATPGSAAAQSHDAHAGHGRPADPHAGHAMPAQPAPQPAPDPHAGHDMVPARPAPAAMADPHAGHAMAGHGDHAAAKVPPDSPASADSTGGPLVEPPPPPAAFSGPAHAADLIFDPAAMAAARRRLLAENGDVRTTGVVIDTLEAGFGDGRDTYAWKAQGWTGGDINRFWWKTEGEGDFGGDLHEAEVQALYSRAVAPFWDVQAGVRQDFRPNGEDATHLALGVQGVAPHWFELGAAAFLSTEGDLTARLEAEYDQRLTQRWILQPALELELSAADAPERDLEAGLTAVTAALRLRYEIRKEFAPYAGVEWRRTFGATAEDDARLVLGIRTWF